MKAPPRLVAWFAGAALTVPGIAGAQSVPEPPVLHAPLEAGSGVVERVGDLAPSPKRIDGHIDDWIGRPAGFGGATVYSAGELIYSDFLFDAHGADDGTDVERADRNAPLHEAFPPSERLGSLSGQVGSEFDIALLESKEQYGDAGYRDAADLVELRLAADAEYIYVLARTATMRGPDGAVLLLFDTDGARSSRAVPFGSGIRSDVADIAVFLTAASGTVADMRTGRSTSVEAAANPEGYVNAIEVALPRALVEREGSVSLSAATGLANPDGTGFAPIQEVGPNLLNVAFRREPVATWMDREQSFALASGTIDGFSLTADVWRLLSGFSESWRPGPGYHERVFVSSESISQEEGLNGIHQHYGVYIPASAKGRVPLTFWMHWRGGKAHSAAVLTPRVYRDNGDLRGGIVVGPRGRGTSSWYLGKGMVDFNEVWSDVHELFSIDGDRVYVTGHSMGGWASYLLPILYPDRFAGALPVAGPVTQGAWTGADFDGCDDLRYEEYTPCYVGTNDSDPRAQHTRRLLENLRNVPIGIFQGGIDELVPTSGVTRQVERLLELGYRHRYYLFPTYEHYSHPVVDEWAEGVRYLDGFRRDPNPGRVVYVRDMPFERSVERGPSQFESPEAGIEFSFDRAYWMSGLEPVDPVNGVARVDAQTLARPEPSMIPLPEVGGPSALGQVGPFGMTGLAWLPGATPPRLNSFTADLQGAGGVRFDLPRMGISTRAPIVGRISSDAPLRLRLLGNWTGRETVMIGLKPVPARIQGRTLVVDLPRGASVLKILPG